MNPMINLGHRLAPLLSAALLYFGGLLAVLAWPMRRADTPGQQATYL